MKSFNSQTTTWPVQDIADSFTLATPLAMAPTDAEEEVAQAPFSVGIDSSTEIVEDVSSSGLGFTLFWAALEDACFFSLFWAALFLAASEGILC